MFAANKPPEVKPKGMQDYKTHKDTAAAGDWQSY
jgi:hypothetical protein